MWEQALSAADRAAAAKTEGEIGSQVKGAMHDGSKRRLCVDLSQDHEDEADEFDVISMTSATVLQQGPVVPNAANSGGDPKNYELPPGVESVEMWGKTICTLPKVSARRLTYEKLIVEAEHNAETKDYLKWIHHNAHKSAKAADFKKYMEVTKYDPCQIAVVNYPGTSAIREFGM
eukprot:s828_g9.t1